MTAPPSERAWANRRAQPLERLRLRHAALRALRSFFDERSFIEVETPTCVRSPGLEPHLEAFEVLGRPGERWLVTSPEYHMKRLLAAGMARIYQVCRCFRRDEQGALHEPEFTMLEWYRAGAGSDEVMRDTEQLVAHLATSLHGRTRLRFGGSCPDVAPPWPRLRVDEAFRRYAGVEIDDLLPDEERFFRTLIEEVEPHLGHDAPVFLTHYPASMAALARLHPDEPAYADRFEAYVAGMELCNGFGELVDAAEQRRRLEAEQAQRRAHGRPIYPIDERFLAALEEGVPASGGNALGIDRLMMVLCNAARIDEVIAFSADRA